MPGPPFLSISGQGNGKSAPPNFFFSSDVLGVDVTAEATQSKENKNVLEIDD